MLEFARTLDERPELITWRQGRCLAYGDGVRLRRPLRDRQGARRHPRLGRRRHGRGEARGRAARGRGPRLAAPAPAPAARPRGSPASQEESFAAWTRFLEHIAADGPDRARLRGPALGGRRRCSPSSSISRRRGSRRRSSFSPRRGPSCSQRAPRAAGGRQRVDRLTLSPLDPQDAGRLVSVLLDERLATEVRAPILERVGGNPLYAEEYVRLLLDRGLLSRPRACCD